MGACTAPICHLLSLSSSSSPSSNPEKSPNYKPRKPPNFKIPPINTSIVAPLSLQRRQLLLFSIPFSLTLQLGSSFASSEVVLDFLSPEEREASAVVSLRVVEAVELLEKANELQAQGDFNQALLYFTQVIDNYKDFALSEYARVGRALALYEVGDRDQAIAEMEDVSISLKGYPEVHAALAAALYVDKNAPLLAENQFTIATLLDPHYTDISYVRDTKHWPPSLITSLQHFITFS